jgi:hypothetical protein
MRIRAIFQVPVSFDISIVENAIPPITYWEGLGL